MGRRADLSAALESRVFDNSQGLLSTAPFSDGFKHLVPFTGRKIIRKKSSQDQSAVQQNRHEGYEGETRDSETVPIQKRQRQRRENAFAADRREIESQQRQ
jgi:hypothetical protein